MLSSLLYTLPSACFQPLCWVPLFAAAPWECSIIFGTLGLALHQKQSRRRSWMKCLLLYCSKCGEHRWVSDLHQSVVQFISHAGMPATVLHSLTGTTCASQAQALVRLLVVKWSAQSGSKDTIAFQTSQVWWQRQPLSSLSLWYPSLALSMVWFSPVPWLMGWGDPWTYTPEKEKEEKGKGKKDGPKNKTKQSEEENWFTK